jgi:hypothetical protein
MKAIISFSMADESNFPTKRFLKNTYGSSAVEATFSLQVDFDKGNAITVAGYAKRWNWGRKTVMPPSLRKHLLNFFFGCIQSQ